MHFSFRRNLLLLLMCCISYRQLGVTSAGTLRIREWAMCGVSLARPAAGGGLMFCWCYFLKCRPCYLTTGGHRRWKNITTTNSVNFDRGTLPWQPILRRETATSLHTGTCVYCLCWHFTRDGNIATPIVALTLTMIPLRPLKFREVWSNNHWDLVAHLHDWWVHVRRPKYAVRWFLKVIR